MRDILIFGAGALIGIFLVAAYTQASEPSLGDQSLVVLSSISANDLSTIQDAEATLIAKDGSYKQVIKGEAIASLQLPQNAEVNIYDAPGGKGYEIRYEDVTNYYSIGFGPEAVARTWTQPKVIASTTSDKP